MAGDDFAGLLRELKERSGLSYGALGKRLHMSGSTLHRYVSGEVVPVEFAPVERLARVCRATPEELLELHRRWIRADALRGVKKEETERPEEPEGPVGSEGPKDSEGAGSQEPEEPAVADSAPAVLAPPAPPAPPVPPRRRVPRAALYAATGVVAVSAAVALVANLVSSPDDTEGSRRPAGAVAHSSASQSGTAPASPSTSPSTSSSPSVSLTPSGSPPASPTRTGGATPSRQAPPTGTPFTVATNPYYWYLPCDHAFLVDRSPENVPKPPPQQGAVGWAAPLKAVSANRQEVVLTVQGTGPETVILEDLHVRVVSSGPALDWNQYVMGNGCGGQVDTKSFDVSLDLGTPTATPIGGQRDFPYSVSESDAEVFHVTAHTSGQDVRWYLELEWSSGGRHEVTRVDDHGRPFRTSASRNARYYAYPLGGDGGWELVEGD
ncbi:helix-turn-helix domain-containing protein [Streptomyces sp. NA03103]|uniref:helix-turn-helix domain-containing protein n=1 Tax=unclassified Streptomyces TaxID=2593676 RepID=UPI00159155DA|nr:helix-turn-helix transcriptional regulator [Streptomyces sp. NA03103]QKW61888.1 helix-turn-helix domain-containing protein [Streptomyces sp. NA03103]WSU02158.1 helix-turn-helix domain-containing protein [Streptomyces sp. NBC_01124]